jgi:hypothetical protein
VRFDLNFVLTKPHSNTLNRSSGGVLINVTARLPSFIINGGAHHLGIRLAFIYNAFNFTLETVLFRWKICAVPTRVTRRVLSTLEIKKKAIFGNGSRNMFRRYDHLLLDK